MILEFGLCIVGLMMLCVFVALALDELWSEYEGTGKHRE
jgi:hypothetical protein